MKKLLLLSLFMLGFSNFSFAQVALSENFESTTFPPTGWTTIDTHPTNFWKRTTTAISGTGSAYVQWIAADQDESLISPSFSLAGYTAAFLDFTASVGYEYMVDPYPNGNLSVSISSNGGTSWNELWVEEDYGLFTDYQNLNIHLDLAAYVGQTNLKIKFQYVANDADTVKIDNISVSSCSPAGGVGLTALTDTTATTTWTGTSASYDFEWGPLGFTQGTGTLSNQTTTTFSFSSLTPGTGYSYYIRPNCGGTNTGAWQGPYNLYTLLLTPTNINYAYGFESGTFGTAGWTTSAPATGAKWQQFTGTGTVVQEGTLFAGCGASGAASNAWLYSRGMNFTAGTTYTISYYARKYDNAGTASVNNLKSTIGTAANSASQTTTLGTHAPLTNLTYAQQTYTYTAPTTGVYYLAFNCYSPAHTTANNGYSFVDNVTVTNPLAIESFNSGDKFSVLPNPAKDIVTITNKENLSIIEVVVLDLNGKVLKNVKYSNVSDAQLNVSDLSSGIYIMNIVSDKNIETKKLIKE